MERLNKTRLSSIRIVLVNASHPGNIGAVARAMANMGLSQLCLVAPRQFPHEQVTARAAGADHLLAGAEVVDDLDQALVGCQLIVGTSARLRSVPWPQLDARAAAKQIATSASSSTVAVLFGREHAGLTNTELARCHLHLSIPCDPDFSSLNLAAAVQVVAYELRMAAMGEPSVEMRETAQYDQLATADEVRGFYEHLNRVLHAVHFLRGENKKLILRLQRLFNRAKLEQKEIHILRGILTAVESTLDSQKK